jgi:hypothetical protein
MLLNKQQQDTFDQIIKKWTAILGIRAAMFGNRKSNPILQVQFDAQIIEYTEESVLFQAFSEFHSELVKCITTDIEIEYVKVEDFDIASDIFWTLAAMGLEK